MRIRPKKRKFAFGVTLIILLIIFGSLAIGLSNKEVMNKISPLTGGIIQKIKHIYPFEASEKTPGAEKPEQPDSPGSPSDKPSDKPEYIDITIASVGDILIHNTLYYAAYEPVGRTYDFSGQFKYVKPYLQDADITIANLETVLAGSEKAYSGYPKFNTPDTIVDALKDCGVDILTAANNHRMDQGVSGFYRTIEVVRDKGLDIIGVKAAEKEETYVIKEIQGVKTAFINFGYGYPLWDGSLDINGLIMPVNMSGLIDTFDPQDLDKSMLVLEKKINAVKKDGAEIIVVCMHWGDEYHRLPNDFQKALASRIVSLGADAIFGGHPHVLQPAVYLTSPEGNQVPVFYSQGNFISDQRLETVDDIYTEQGIIAKVTFRVLRSEADTASSLKPASLEVIDAEAIPTWVNKKIINSRFVYEVIPAQEALDSRIRFPLLTDADIERIRFCRDTVRQLASEY